MTELDEFLEWFHVVFPETFRMMMFWVKQFRDEKV